MGESRYLTDCHAYGMVKGDTMLDIVDRIDSFYGIEGSYDGSFSRLGEILRQIQKSPRPESRMADWVSTYICSLGMIPSTDMIDDVDDNPGMPDHLMSLLDSFDGYIVPCHYDIPIDTLLSSSCCSDKDISYVLLEQLHDMMYRHAESTICDAESYLRSRESLCGLDVSVSERLYYNLAFLKDCTRVSSMLDKYIDMSPKILFDDYICMMADIVDKHTEDRHDIGLLEELVGKIEDGMQERLDTLLRKLDAYSEGLDEMGCAYAAGEICRQKGIHETGQAYEVLSRSNSELAMLENEIEQDIESYMPDLFPSICSKGCCSQQNDDGPLLGILGLSERLFFRMVGKRRYLEDDGIYAGR